MDDVRLLLRLMLQAPATSQGDLRESKTASFTLAACTLVLIGQLAAPAEAAGLIRRLPPDGTWSRFALEVSRIDKEGDISILATGSCTVRSVGRQVREAGALRRIEFEFRVDRKNQQEFVEVFSVLIPESRLVGDDDPTRFIEEAWQKMPNERHPGAVPLRNLDHLRNALLSWVAHGRLEDAKTLAVVTVHTKLGDVECAGVAGSRVIGHDGVQDHYRYVARLAPVAPFGVVRLQSELRRQLSGGEWSGTVLRRTFTLAESGQAARPAIPEADGTGDPLPATHRTREER
ncbi:hypothetical protein [Maioricimonas sp. JC845]|uniref:hypothetical protein n=1 Tax=Maioricimonas sp. JC845 TaxID=3232138 RepID=UPI0034583A31